MLEGGGTSADFMQLPPLLLMQPLRHRQSHGHTHTHMHARTRASTKLGLLGLPKANFFIWRAVILEGGSYAVIPRMDAEHVKQHVAVSLLKLAANCS